MNEKTLENFQDCPTKERLMQSTTTPSGENPGAQSHLEPSMQPRAGVAQAPRQEQGTRRAGPCPPELPPGGGTQVTVGVRARDVKTAQGKHVTNAPAAPRVGAGKASLRRGCLSHKLKDRSQKD